MRPLVMGRELFWSHRQGWTCLCVEVWGETPSFLKLGFQNALGGPWEVGRSGWTRPTQWRAALPIPGQPQFPCGLGMGRKVAPNPHIQPNGLRQQAPPRILRLGSEGTHGNLCVHRHVWFPLAWPLSKPASRPATGLVSIRLADSLTWSRRPTR